MKLAALGLALVALVGPLLREARAQRSQEQGGVPASPPGADPDESPPPAASTPAPIAPPFTARENLAHVTLRSDEPGTFYLVRGGFDRLCTAPCEVELPVGLQRLAISEDKGKYLTGPAVEIRDGVSVHASRETHGIMRGVGVALLVAGPIGSLALLIAYVGSVKTQVVCSGVACGPQTQSEPGLLAAGALLLPVTIAPGVLMVVFGRDRARFAVEGGTALAPWPRDVAALRGVKEGPSSAPGLAATLRF